MTVEYSRVVKVLKIGLPVIGALFLLAVLLWPDRHQKIRSDSGQIPEERELLHLINARFLTSDKKNQPIAITADKAEEVALGSKLVRMENFKADIQLQDKTFLMAESERGIFNRDINVMQTEAPLIINTDTGYRLTMRRATLDLAKRTLFGGKTDGFGPMGEGQAGSIHYYDKRQLLVLKTSPKITLKNAKRQTIISADTINFLLKSDEIDAVGGVKATLDGTSEFTADRTKISHHVKDKKRTVKHLNAGSNIVFRTTRQTAIADTLIFKAEEDLAIMKGNPVVMTMDGMEIRTPEIHYSPSEMMLTAVGSVIIRRTDGSTITGDVMKVYLGENHQPMKMEGIGNIVAKTAEETLYADFAVYYFDTEILRAEHNIILVRGPNELTGDFATMNFKNGISRIEMTSTPVEAIVDPKDESLKDAGQSTEKRVKEEEAILEDMRERNELNPDERDVYDSEEKNTEEPLGSIPAASSPGEENVP